MDPHPERNRLRMSQLRVNSASIESMACCPPPLSPDIGPQIIVPWDRSTRAGARSIGSGVPGVITETCTRAPLLPDYAAWHRRWTAERPREHVAVPRATPLEQTPGGRG